MDSYNLAICFGPTLMPIPDGQDPVACQAHVNEVIKTIIIHNEAIFPSQRELDGPVYEKCMTGGEEYWWVLARRGSEHVSEVQLCWQKLKNKICVIYEPITLKSKHIVHKANILDVNLQSLHRVSFHCPFASAVTAPTVNQELLMRLTMELNHTPVMKVSIS